MDKLQQEQTHVVGVFDNKKEKINKMVHIGKKMIVHKYIDLKMYPSLCIP